MVSSDGLKTWFDYQLLFAGLAIAFIGLTVVSSEIVAYLGTLPFADVDIDPADPTFALAVTGGGILVILLLVVLAGLVNRERE